MRILVIGANGKIGRPLVKQLARSAHEVRALVRDAAHIDDLRALGADTVVGDIEDGIGDALAGSETVIFTAGSGPRTGPEKTLDVDRDGAIRTIDSARAKGVRRFILVSAMRTRSAADAPETLRHYLEAKRAADDHLMASGLAYTIVRPGRLTNEAATGRIHASTNEVAYDEIPREDVATVLAGIVDTDGTVGLEISLTTGDTPIQEALRAL